MAGQRLIKMKSTFFLWVFLLISHPAGAAPVADQLARLITSGGCVAMAGRQEIVAYQGTRSFIPASTIKIATLFAALETLGASQPFKTEFYLRERTILVIKGYGDPFLTSEYLPAIARALRQRGVASISSIILDDSFFRLEAETQGSTNSQNPYDAPNAALAVNFNALPLVKSDDGAILSAEEQTPLLPLMQEIGEHLPPGEYRLNISAFPQRSAVNNILRYTAELFITLFRAGGIKVADSYRRGTVSATDVLLYTHRSPKDTSEVVRNCLRYSNNFIANQLFLLSGAKRYGPPATWSKGRDAMRSFLQEKIGGDSRMLYLVEGSGLSRDNRATPRAMIKLLEAFRPYASLLDEKDGVLIKSGTLSGVNNYAGYFKSAAGLDPFVIFLNQPANTRKELLFLLRQIHRQDTDPPKKP